MIKFPDELYDCTHWDAEKGETVLNEDATAEQTRIFEEFYRDLENGTLTDREVKIIP